ncbi:MAG: hypothetical protein KAJ31_00330, partial [Deltaproteobacteria bacterium]|nr:hypothetical protein [Deltaproteobacteria bacterium]
MKNRISKSEKGLALTAVVIFACIFLILGFSLLKLANTEIVMTRKELHSTQAFYAAEAGMAQLTTKLYNEQFEDIADTALGEANYQVDLNLDADPPYAISTGSMGMEYKLIKAELSFLSPSYEKAIYGGNAAGEQWSFVLRGQGNPQPDPDPNSSREIGGKDIVNGNMYVNGDATMYEESSVNPTPMGNFNGDVDS